jgi:hypothetical protein
MTGWIHHHADGYPVLVASSIAVRVEWSNLPPELRAQIKIKRGPRPGPRGRVLGTYLTPLGPGGEAWIADAVRRFGLRRWLPRRGWVLSHLHTKPEGGV